MTGPNYIGGKRNDVCSFSKTTNNHRVNNFNNSTSSISFYGRGYFALRGILIHEIADGKKINLYCPDFTCWSTLKKSIEGLNNVEIIQYECATPTFSVEFSPDMVNIILIVDYFGISNLNYITERLPQGVKTILDFAHAFPTTYSTNKLEPLFDYIFCSLRKFLPAQDGAFVISKTKLNGCKVVSENSWTWTALTSLSKNQLLDYLSDRLGIRHRLFESNEKILSRDIISQQSIRTLKFANLYDMAEKRLENFYTLKDFPPLANHLANLPFRMRRHDLNPLYFPLTGVQINFLRYQLIKNRIYTPVFWPELSSKYHCLGLPIDERYGKKEMFKIIDVLRPFLN